MKKIPKQEYTIEFKEKAVKQVKMGKSIGLVAKELGLSFVPDFQIQWTFWLFATAPHGPTL